MTEIRPLAPPDDVRRHLGPAADVLDAMLAEVAADPARIGRLFAGAARRTARGPLPGDEVLVEDAVRVELVAAAAQQLDADRLGTELAALYRFGDSDEKRAVLLALGRLPADAGVDGTELLLDALRTNDTRLVAAAMGEHARRLPIDQWRHGVLKCLFTGVPVDHVAGLADRADAELGAMAERYARERRAAGREVPADVATVIAACPQPQHEQPQHQPTEA
ncbi:EboA domain-containing protein [Nocardioides sp. TF02-7]|uniref:EboA domain-containing protein n=1 Tax=Nocardioides sp. TF02-7 TaxID=2917724 RepID=UPI001F064558|nr:EboA domain-containing protein [Nocardioides sp. TF02-7]UMG92419.1 EboA domain-containing protein [Nocardioides sp. TF02-7]